MNYKIMNYFNDNTSEFLINKIFLLKKIYIRDIACFLIKKANSLSIFLSSNNLNIVNFFKNNIYISLNQVLDFTIIDRLEMSIKKDKRFEFTYLFISTIFNFRIFLRGFVSIFESLISLYNFFSSIV